MLCGWCAGERKGSLRDTDEHIGQASFSFLTAKLQLLDRGLAARYKIFPTRSTLNQYTEKLPARPKIFRELIIGTFRFAGPPLARAK